MAFKMPPTQRGYDAREVVSAFQKSIRRSQVDNALYWGTEIYLSGYAEWAWKRLRIIASEDIGPAGAIGLQADIEALYVRFHDFKKKAGRNADAGEGLMFFMHAVVLLATSTKSRIVDWALFHHGGDHAPWREIPDEALDKHTLRGRQKGRGFEHFVDEASKLIEPEEDIDELSDMYRRTARVSQSGKADLLGPLPQNPWGGVGADPSKAEDPSTTQDLPQTLHLEGINERLVSPQTGGKP